MWSFCSSVCSSLVTAELPILALIFVRAAMPMHIGSSDLVRCTLLAGITIRPRATSLRISSSGRSSRWATNFISGVISLFLARSNWVIGDLRRAWCGRHYSSKKIAFRHLRQPALPPESAEVASRRNFLLPRTTELLSSEGRKFLTLVELPPIPAFSIREQPRVKASSGIRGRRFFRLLSVRRGNRGRRRSSPASTCRNRCAARPT